MNSQFWHCTYRKLHMTLNLFWPVYVGGSRGRWLVTAKGSMLFPRGFKQYSDHLRMRKTSSAFNAFIFLYYIYICFSMDTQYVGGRRGGVLRGADLLLLGISMLFPRGLKAHTDRLHMPAWDDCKAVVFCFHLTTLLARLNMSQIILTGRKIQIK